MISCKFCGAKSQPQYLFLLCRHVACISCTFLRADFAEQEIQCCGKSTKIDENALEIIIKSKRNFRNAKENNDGSPINSIRTPKESTPFKQTENRIEYRYESSPIQVESTSKEKPERKSIKSNQLTHRNKKQCIDQQQPIEFQSILMTRIEKIRKQFEIQRQILKQKQQTAIKELVSLYEEKVKKTQRPPAQTKLEKLSLALEKQTSRTQRKENQKESILQDKTQFGNLEKTKQSYDHILKRLQANQQRMKEKIQRHLY